MCCSETSSVSNSSDGGLYTNDEGRQGTSLKSLVWLTERGFLFCVVGQEEPSRTSSCFDGVLFSFQETMNKVTGSMRVSLVLGPLPGVRVGSPEWCPGGRGRPVPGSWT